MFSPAIVCSDAFLDMPSTGRDLYFQLGMYADDDGFVNPRKIMRMLGSSEDDLKILIAKRFVLPFPSGVVVVKHWKINNLVRKDWYRPTQYIEEKSTLYVKENGSYTQDSAQGMKLVNEPLTEVRLGKVKEKAIEAPIASSLVAVSEDSEGRQRPPRPARDTRAWALRAQLYTRLKEDTGIDPTPHAGDYKQVQLALKQGLSEKDCMDLFEDELGKGKVL